MVAQILALVLFLVFMVLSGFHFYWFFGGEWGLAKVIPSKGSQAETLAIPKFATLLVAIVLLSFGLIYLLSSGIIQLQLPKLLTNFVYWFIPVIFILRSIGEFRYVGFFKNIKDTDFAKADTQIFSPLCLGIGVFGILIQIM